MMKCPFPEHIRHIAIIAPAGIADKVKLAESCRLLENCGLKVSVMPHVHAGSTMPYLAADAADKVADIHACWRDPSIQLILAARGGYGSAQILPLLDWELLRQRPLPLLGYSDLTALQLAMLSQGVGVPVAAPMAVHLGEVFNDRYTCDWLNWSLKKKRQTRSCLDSQNNRLTVIREGQVTGKIVPANLMVLCSLLGTPYLPEFSDSILLLEDINEPVYKIDRALTQLLLSGIIEKCRGIIFGSFRRCGNQKERLNLFKKISDHCPGPVVSGFKFGHSLPMICLPYSAITEITATDTVKLEVS